MLDVVNPYPPTPFQSLMFYCQDPVSMRRNEGEEFDQQPGAILVGPQVSRVNIRVTRRLRAIRVDFMPGGLFRIMRVPMFELLDGGYDANDFFGSAMKEVNEQLCNLSNLDDGISVVEKFLLKQVTDLQPTLPLDSALQVMLQKDGNIPIEQVASLSCLSLKQFERKCRERIGMNPKMYARILKFSKAYRLHEANPQLSWTKIAYEAGYFDQMHMIRDFKSFAGVNPSVIERQLQSTPHPHAARPALLDCLFFTMSRAGCAANFV
ncbi:MAG: helix-turn-helix domain-containing protein [Chitinophagaceae bacterium]|nr:helix-turn-helix domain-containing protein [Chitinophagaceae bacterium]